MSSVRSEVGVGYGQGMVAFAVKTPPQHGRWAEFLDVWKVADDIEVFESAWVMDHFYPLTPPLDGTHLESWTMLAALAMATRRLRLGCMVNGMHYRHPAVTANAAVTIDHISGGRFVLGLGAGWFEPESNAYGIPLGTLTERFDRFDEGVEVICSLLSNEVTNFSGRYYVLTDARCNPKPVQSRLPIAIGGKGPKRTLPTVARWADHWDTTATDVVQWKALSDVLDGECAAIGRHPGEIRRSVHLMWEAVADPVELAARAAEFGDAGVDLVIFSMRGPYQARLLDPLAAALTG
jgi:F420-dependent oxidoreductase-like protein